MKKMGFLLLIFSSTLQGVTRQQAQQLYNRYMQIYNPSNPAASASQRSNIIQQLSPSHRDMINNLNAFIAQKSEAVVGKIAQQLNKQKAQLNFQQQQNHELKKRAKQWHEARKANSQLQSQLQAEREQAATLQQQAQAIKQQNLQLYNKITQQDQQASKIKQQIASAQQENEQLREQVTQLQPVAQLAEKLVPVLQKQNQKKDALISSAQQQNKQLHEQVTQLQTQSKLNEQQQQAESQTIQNLRAQLEQTQKQLQNQALQQQVLTAQQLKNTELQQQQIAHLQNALNKQKLEIQQEFKNRLKKYQTTQESKHQEQISRLNQQNQQLQQQLNISKEQLQNQKPQYEEQLNTEKEKLQIQLKTQQENTDRQHKIIEGEVNRLTSKNKLLEQELDQLKNLNEENKRLNSKLEQLTSHNNNLKKKILEEEKAKTSFATKNLAQISQIVDLEKEKNQLQQTLQNFKTAQTAWKNTQNKLKEQLQLAKQQQAKLNKEIENLKTQQQQTESNNLNLQEQLKEKQQQQLNEQQINFESQINQLKEEKKDLENSLEAKLEIPQNEIRTLTLKTLALKDQLKKKDKEKEIAIASSKKERENALDKLKAEHLNAQKELQKQLKQQKDENDRIRAELANQTKQNETNKQQLEESATESQTIKQLQNQLEQEKQQHLKALSAQKEASAKVLKATRNTLINLKNENKQLTRQLNKQKQSIETLKQEIPKGKTSSPINEQKSISTDKSTFASRLSSSSAATQLAFAKQKTYGNLQTHPLFKTLDLDEKTSRTVKFGNKTYRLKNPKQSAIDIKKNLAYLPTGNNGQKETELAKKQQEDIKKVKAEVDEKLKKVSAQDLSTSLSISNLDDWEKIARAGIHPEGSCGEKYAKNGTISLFTIHGTWSHKAAFGGDIHTLTTYNIFKFACQEAAAQKKKVEVISVSWSGDLNLKDRKNMAASLANEFKEKSNIGNEIWAIAHSHGCNIAAMAANQFHDSEGKLADVGIFMGFPTLDVGKPLDFETVYAFYAQGDFTQVAGSAQSAANFDRKVPDFMIDGRKVYNIRMQLGSYDMDHVSIKWGVMPHLAKILTYIDTYYPKNFDLEANVETDPNSLPLVAIRRKEAGQNPAIGKAAEGQDQRAREAFKEKYERDISTLGIKYINGITWLLNLAREAQSAWKGEPSIDSEYLEQIQDSSSNRSSTSSDNK